MQRSIARTRHRPRGRPRHPDILTPVEWAITRWVRAGMTNVEIAQLRGCRADTIRDHIASILGKLELADRAALGRWRGVPLPGEELPGIDLRTIERKQRMSHVAVNAAIFTGGSPLFFVDDVARTCEWYRDHLGFEVGEYFREDHGPHDDDPNHPALGEPIYAIISRDGQRLMFKRSIRRGEVRSNHDIEASSCDMYFWVEDVEALCESVQASHATFIHGLIIQPYGLAEFAIQDCDGRVVRLGGPPAS